MIEVRSTLLTNAGPMQEKRWFENEFVAMEYFVNRAILWAEITQVVDVIKSHDIIVILFTDGQISIS